MTITGASAPGKALLCGEYAVLEGAPAVVAAVDRRVSVRWAVQSAGLPPEVEATLRLAEEQCGPAPSGLAIDVSALQRDQIKLGLGSSAAASVATAGAIFASYGHDLSKRTVRDRVFDCALEGHAIVAPQGSGVDVAAATYGGFLRFERSGNHTRSRSLECPDSLAIRLVWTGRAARTSELLRKVHGFRRDDPDGYRICMSRLARLAAAFARAFDAGEAGKVVEQARAYAEALRVLGESARAPIIEERLQCAAELAVRFSGGAKPCGAGGGDVAIAFFVDPESAEAFEHSCSGAGLHPIEVKWGAAGVQPIGPTDMRQLSVS